MSNKETSDKNVVNIEKDIEMLRNLDTTGDEEFTQAIENILAEREQGKKRIQELEEENRKKQAYINMASEVIENSILKQKVKDVLQNNRNELFCITYVSEKQYEPYTKQIDRINKIEQELLEGEK